jgi:hypothetical protein
VNLNEVVVFRARADLNLIAKQNELFEAHWEEQERVVKRFLFRALDFSEQCMCEQEERESHISYFFLRSWYSRIPEKLIFLKKATFFLEREKICEGQEAINLFVVSCFL